MRFGIALVLVVSLVPLAARAQDGGAPGPDASVEADAAAAPVAFPPAFVGAPAMPYPEWADGAPIEVDVLVTVGRDGRVVAVELAPHRSDDARPPPDPRAVDEVVSLAREAVFHPATVDGVPVPARAGWHVVLEPPVSATIVAPDAGVPPPPAHDGGSAAPPDAGRADEPAFGASAHGERPPEPRAPSDFYTPVGELRGIPRASAGHLLDTAAPGALVTNEGGEGHADQIALRGFDAAEATDVELTVDGVPVNEAGNPHGEGYADTHFVIPELVRTVRVVEGPYDPHQGNYAVAGSADFTLGLDRPDLVVSYGYGSFDTHRVLGLFRPEGSLPGTFGGVELRSTDGFGQNRAAQRATAMGGYELALSDTVRLRILATAYANRYGMAGAVREDDYLAGRIGFYGTYDPTQGGDDSRYSLATTLEQRTSSVVARLQLFTTRRDLRIRENFTGFVEDAPMLRGDEVDQAFGATTIGSRGSVKLQTTWLERPQSVEVGYYARWDGADASMRRLLAGTTTPYAVDLDLGESLTDVAAYIDTDLHLLPMVALRGGVRADYFGYDVLDRSTSTRSSADALVVLPRATLVLGPLEGVSLAGSFGMATRAADPTTIVDRASVPLTTVASTEGGVVLDRDIDDARLSARLLYYYAHLDRDLIFDERIGRAVLAPGTERQGVLLAARLTAPWIDTSLGVTFANARFGSDAGAAMLPAGYGNRVPYVPEWVLRSDTAVFGTVPWVVLDGHRFIARAALGISFASQRPLPYGENGSPLFLLDASLSLRYRGVELGVSGQNLLDLRYRAIEREYVSSFDPTMPPSGATARHFIAGAPLSIFVTLTLHFGPGAWDVGA